MSPPTYKSYGNDYDEEYTETYCKSDSLTDRSRAVVCNTKYITTLTVISLSACGVLKSFYTHVIYGLVSQVIVGGGMDVDMLIFRSLPSIPCHLEASE